MRDDDNLQEVTVKQAEEKLQSLKNRTIISGVLSAVFVLAGVFVMVQFPGNYLAVLCVLMPGILCLFLFISTMFEFGRLQRRLDEAKMEDLYKAQKASYLVIRKSFDELSERIGYLEEASSIPADEIISAQKAMAKVTINRNKENTDALMNSNDMLLDKVFSFQETLEGNNKALLSQQQDLLNGTKAELLQKNQELLQKNMELEKEFMVLRQALSGIENKVTSLESRGASSPSVIINQGNSGVPQASVSQAAVQQPVSVAAAPEPMAIPEPTAIPEPVAMPEILPESVPEILPESVPEMDFSTENISLDDAPSLDDIALPESELEMPDLSIPDIELPDAGDILIPEASDIALPEGEDINLEDLSDIEIGSTDDILASIDADLAATAEAAPEIPAEPEAVPEIEIPAEPEPEPVAEPEPAPEPEPVAEPEPAPEPEPVAEPEPAPEPAAAPAPEVDLTAIAGDDPNKKLDPNDIAALFAAANGGGDAAPAAEPEPAPEPEPEPAPEPAAAPEVDLTAIAGDDPNKKLDPNDIAALFAAANGGGDAAPAAEPEPAPEPEPEPAPDPAADAAAQEAANVADALAGLDTSDPNKVMSPEEIQKLFASL